MARGRRGEHDPAFAGAGGSSGADGDGRAGRRVRAGPRDRVRPRRVGALAAGARAPSVGPPTTVGGTGPRSPAAPSPPARALADGARVRDLAGRGGRDVGRRAPAPRPRRPRDRLTRPFWPVGSKSFRPRKRSDGGYPDGHARLTLIGGGGGDGGDVAVGLLWIVRVHGMRGAVRRRLPTLPSTPRADPGAPGRAFGRAGRRRRGAIRVRHLAPSAPPGGWTRGGRSASLSAAAPVTGRRRSELAQPNPRG
jgi:hypothetical protein